MIEDVAEFMRAEDAPELVIEEDPIDGYDPDLCPRILEIAESGDNSCGEALLEGWQIGIFNAYVVDDEVHWELSEKGERMLNAGGPTMAEMITGEIAIANGEIDVKAPATGVIR